MRRKIIILFAGWVVIIGLSVGVAALVSDVPLGQLAALFRAARPDHSAQYYPQDTAVYVSMDLKPTSRNARNLQVIWDRFNESELFIDFIDGLESDLFESTSIDFREDVSPWIGFQYSMGLYWNEDSEAPTGVSTVGVRDKDAAADFLARWITILRQEHDIDLAAGSFNGFDTWMEGDGEFGLALTDDRIILATAKDALHGMLARIAGDDEPSLANSDSFVDARDAMPGGRFASIYVNVDTLVEFWPLLSNTSNLFGANAIDAPASVPTWVAASATWVDRGIVLEWLSPILPELGFEAPDLEDPASELPRDTLGFMAATFDPDVDNWRSVLNEYTLAEILEGSDLEQSFDDMMDLLPGLGLDSGESLTVDSPLADFLDVGLSLAEGILGVDLEEDIFDHLTGTVILGVQESVLASFMEGVDANPIGGFGMLSVSESGADEIGQTIETLVSLVGVNPELVDVGSEGEARIYEIPGSQYDPGYVVHDGYLTMGSTSEVIESIVGAQNGEGPTLDSEPEYRRAVQHLPESRQILFYLDLNNILEQISAESETGNLLYLFLADTFGAVALTSGSDENYTRIASVVTLFPE